MSVISELMNQNRKAKRQVDKLNVTGSASARSKVFGRSSNGWPTGPPLSQLSVSMATRYPASQR